MREEVIIVNSFMPYNIMTWPFVLWILTQFTELKAIFYWTSFPVYVTINRFNWNSRYRKKYDSQIWIRSYKTINYNVADFIPLGCVRVANLNSGFVRYNTIAILFKIVFICIYIVCHKIFNGNYTSMIQFNSTFHWIHKFDK